jgi:hypothetical protein
VLLCSRGSYNLIIAERPDATRQGLWLTGSLYCRQASAVRSHQQENNSHHAEEGSGAGGYSESDQLHLGRRWPIGKAQANAEKENKARRSTRPLTRLEPSWMDPLESFLLLPAASAGPVTATRLPSAILLLQVSTRLKPVARRWCCACCTSRQTTLTTMV